MMQQSDESAYPTRSASDAPTGELLLIDDDQAMGEMLAEYLAPEGYPVRLAYTAEDGLECLGQGGILLIILDVMLPDRDGFSVLREIRQKSRIPVIMLTTRGTVSDKVLGLEAGADDYVPKPFTPIELLARIRSVLRRGQPWCPGGSFLIVDDLVLDAGARTVQRREKPIECTSGEFDLLYGLVSCAGEVVSREHLTQVALGRSPYAGDRGIDNLVSALRKKLGPHADGQERFRSVRNTGYVYSRASSAAAREQKG